MITNKPLISIITPVKNGANYIQSCIESVLSQPNTEHVIVDGASTDNTPNIIAHYKAIYPTCIVTHSIKDRGIGDAWNWGIAHANGEILGWLGHDDLLYPEAVSKVVKFFANNPDAVFVYGECKVIDADSKFIGMYITEKYSYRRLLNNRCFIACTSAFYRKEIFNTCGLFKPFGSDYEFFLRVGKHYSMHYLEGETLSQFRIHDKNNSKVNSVATLNGIYRDSLKYGGSIFNVWGRLYYSTKIVNISTKIVNISDPLKPLLGWSYPLLKPLLDWSYPLFRKILYKIAWYSVLERKPK